MPNPFNDKLKFLIVGAFALILGIGIGVAISRNPSSPSFEVSERQIVQALNDKLDSKVKNELISFNLSRTIKMEEGAPVSYLTGKILKVNAQNNTIEVKAGNIYKGGDLFSYLNEPDFYVKTVKIDSQTKIVRAGNGTEKEMPAAREGIESGGNELISKKSAPAEIEMTISDLKVGSKVSVETDPALNIKDNSEIKAKKIKTGI